MTTSTVVSDPAPKDMHIGAINPYALVEGILGKQVDRNSLESARVISDVLQTDYDELFDLKYDSVLYAGLKLNPKENMAEPVSAREMHTLTEKDLETPDLSKIEKVSDLHGIGLKDVGATRVKQAWMQNGKLNMVLHPHALGRTLSNLAVTSSISELVTRFRRSEKEEWTPPNCTWRDMEYFFKDVTEYNDPVQGAVGNSWLIAAIFAVYWADPYAIVHGNRASFTSDTKRVLAIKLHSKGGSNDAPTETVKVNYDIAVNNSSNLVAYCRSSDTGEMWPSLYEKAFAKWITRTSSDHPDITQTGSGDPVKAMAQINDKTPHYYFTSSRSANDLQGLVRANCMNFRTINPMTAWTQASDGMYKGSNIVANHAYTVLGWASQGGKPYIILRNPWGVTEPAGLTTYPGLLDSFDTSFWRPTDMLDTGGVFALEASAFKNYFAGLGVAK
ncbi:cysteine proteinase [Cadophora sp. DSE1049]|nr:cysteine proteinase [Cadophora sp. DSE1049]